MDLAEDHLLLGTVQRAPRPNAPFHCPPHAAGKLGVPTLHLFEDRHAAKTGCRLQHRHDVAVEDVGQRIRTAPAPDLLPGRRRPVVMFEAICGGGTDRCLRRRNRRRLCLTELHVEPHLVIGDMAAGQWTDPFDEKINPHIRSVAITRHPASRARSRPDLRV